MRLASEVYNYYLYNSGALGIGDILIPVDGVYVNIENVPNSYICDRFGYTKEAFLAMLTIEVEASYVEENLCKLPQRT